MLTRTSARDEAQFTVVGARAILCARCKRFSQPNGSMRSGSRRNSRRHIKTDYFFRVVRSTMLAISASAVANRSATTSSSSLEGTPSISAW